MKYHNGDVIRFRSTIEYNDSMSGIPYQVPCIMSGRIVKIIPQNRKCYVVAIDDFGKTRRVNPKSIIESDYTKIIENWKQRFSGWENVRNNKI